MTQNDIALKQFNLVPADNFVFESAKSSRYAVGDLTTLDQFIDRGRTAVDIRLRGISEYYSRFAGRAIRNRKHLLKREVFPV